VSLWATVYGGGIRKATPKNYPLCVLQKFEELLSLPVVTFNVVEASLDENQANTDSPTMKYLNYLINSQG
jgi:hypothetical protein